MLDVVVVDTEVYSHYFVLVAMELPAQNLVVIEKLSTKSTRMAFGAAITRTTMAS